MHSYLSTSRGAENFRWAVFCCLRAACISPYLPREGPETFYQFPQNADMLFLYSYLSTSQGAGNGTPSRFSALSLPCVYLPIYLGRGRKHYRISTYFLVNFSRIATYLPREGPETRPHEFLLQDQKLCIDTYLPREGPETDLLLSNVFKNSV